MSDLPINDAIGAAIRVAGHAQAAAENQRGHDLAMDRLREVESIRKQGEIDLLRGQLAQRRSVPMPSGGGMTAEWEEKFQRQREIHERELAARDARVVEWMHSNETFRRLARLFGDRLGVPIEDRALEFRRIAVDLMEEDAKFAKTKFGSEIKKKLAEG